MSETYKRRIVLTLFLAGTVAVFVNYHFNFESPTNKWDFQEFHSAARMLSHGDTTPLRSSLYPAAHALIFLPVSWLPVPAAYVVWTALNILFLLISIRLLQRELNLGGGDWPLFAALLYIPVWACVLHGQLSLLILLLYVCAMVQLRRSKDLTAGILVGLCAIKFHLMLGIVAVMFVRRAWKFVLGAAIGGTVIFGVSTAMVGLQQIVSYPKFLQSVAQQPSVARPEVMINLRGLIYLFTRSEPPVWIVAIASIAVLSYAAYSWRNIETGFPCAVLASTIAAYHAYPQELCLLIPALAVLATRVRIGETAALVAMFSAVLVVYELFVWNLQNVFPLLAVCLLVFLSRSEGESEARRSLEGAQQGVRS